jgi:hypothetical protein
MAVGDLALYSTTASTQAVSIKASASTAAYDFTFPITAPAANTFMRMALGGQGTFVAVNGTANQITVTQNASDMTFSIPTNPILPGNASSAGSFTAGTSLASTTTITAGTSFIGPGSVPVGTIIAIGDSGAWALPASGAIKEGWALCNGQVKPVGSAVGLAANLPDLTDDRFLSGSTAAGGTGGATSKTTSGITASFNKNVMDTNQNAHSHKLPLLAYVTSGGAAGFYSFGGTGASQNGLYGGSSISLGTIIAGVHTSVSTNSSAFTTVSLSDVSTISWASTIVNTTVTQGTIADIRPKYFNVVYLMRVA